MAQKQVRQEKKSKRPVKAKDDAKTEKVEKTAKADKQRTKEITKAVRARADKAVEATKATAKSAAKKAKELEAEARRAQEDYKAAKATAKAVLKAEDTELAPEEAKQLVEEVAAQIVAAEAASVNGDIPETGLTDVLRLKPGAPVDLAAIDTRSTPGVENRAQAEAQLPALAARVAELQERLYAATAGGDSKRRVLLVLQGMDTSGKGGTVRHVVGLLDPNGTRIKAFKAPTPEEREHDFLWRIRNHAPEAGQIGIFDRSHYEDVLVAKVRKLALPMHIGRRYGTINRFEQSLVDEGAVVVKCFLHISPEEQRERLLARLDNPAKHWKYNPGDVDDRLL
ncbi:MAG TPA: PPK2 family polyphosphate kinase, partial [Actinospica sp.]|nr:PPK2 family polyphosphate kinase [Actinospica sp.]